MHMVKVISVSQEAYRLLKLVKKEGSSFSDVIIEHLSVNNENKTEELSDLIQWIKNLKHTGNKKKISQNHDKIIYRTNR